MILKIGICDDEIDIMKQLKDYLEHYSFAYNIDFEVSTFTSGEELLQSYHNAGTYHILFLDVEMPGINGINLANQIRELPDRNVYIVFVSSYPEYMKDSFNVRAFQYLTKPIDRTVFEIELKRIVDDIVHQSSAKLLLPTAENDELIFLDELLYIKSINSKQKRLDFILKDRTIHSQGTIAEYEKKLDTAGFISPTQGYLIHMRYLRYIRKNELVLCNDEIIPLSRRKEKAIRDYFNEQLLLLARKR